MTAHAPPSPATIRPFLAERLRGLDETLAATLPRVHGADDAEAIHDLRVAIRRLRVILKLARGVYGRFLADAVREGFTQVHRATGALRDEEVLEETLGALTLKDPSFASWCRARKGRERRLRRLALVALEDGTLERSRRLLEALVALPVKPSRDVALRKFASRAILRAEREIADRSDAPTDDVVALHDLRIAYKNLRYAAEVFADALSPATHARAKEAAAFQKRLGEIHDLDVAASTVARARALSPATRTRALAELRKHREDRIGRYLILCMARERGEAPLHPPEFLGEFRGELAGISATELRPSAPSRSGKSPRGRARRP